MTAESPRGPDPDPLALLASARAAWAAGRRDEAARRWRMAAAVTPGDAAAYVNIAGTAAPASADTVWVERAAAAIAVGDPLVARNLGVLAQGRGEPERAARSVRRSLILAPDRGATLSVFARLPTVRRGDAAPLRWSVRAAVSNPSVEAVWLDVLTRLCRAGRDAEASARADAIAIPMPSWSSELLALVADLGLRTDRLQRSADALALLTERAPDDVTFRTLRAVLLRRRRELPAAVREGRRAAILRPDLFDCVGSAATAFGFNDQHPEAVRQFRRCLLIDPARRLDILENYGGSLVHTGALPAAARVLREALVRQPERPAGYMNLSSMRFQSGDLAAAVRLGEFALSGGAAAGRRLVQLGVAAAAPGSTGRGPTAPGRRDGDRGPAVLSVRAGDAGTGRRRPAGRPAALRVALGRHRFLVVATPRRRPDPETAGVAGRDPARRHARGLGRAGGRRRDLVCRLSGLGGAARRRGGAGGRCQPGRPHAALVSRCAGAGPRTPAYRGGAAGGRPAGPDGRDPAAGRRLGETGAGRVPVGPTPRAPHGCASATPPAARVPG